MLPAMVLKRPFQPMPLAAYAACPACQRNDYLPWIARAKRVETRKRRQDQMLEELQDSATYMKLVWWVGANKG